MTIHNRDDYIKYRFHRAEESFEEALILAKEERWNAVINRLYYACFYAVIALLQKMTLRHKLMMEQELSLAYNSLRPARLIKI